MTTTRFDVVALGNALLDVISPADEAFLAGEGLDKGGMMLIDEARADALYARMSESVKTSGGSAANTMAGVASFGGKSAFIGKVGADALGEAYADDMRAIGGAFRADPLRGGAGTGRCLINVTPDGERTMCTYLGAAQHLSEADVDRDTVEASAVAYLEGYLFDPPEARRAFAKAAALAHGVGRKIAFTLSDAFVVDRHRGALVEFIETQVDILFANETEITSLFEVSTFEEAAAALRGRVDIAALTRSAQGSVILNGADDHNIAAAPVAKVMDTTGAGDQYAAGFLFGYTRGRPLAECGRLGSLAAGEVISHYGPRPETPLARLAGEAGAPA